MPLSADRRGEFAALVEGGFDRATHGIGRWWRGDLKRVIVERLGVASHQRPVATIFRALGFSSYQTADNPMWASA